MSFAVWKFATHFPPTGGAFSVSMPAGAKVLSFGLDPKDAMPVIWALVDTTSPTEERHFAAVWTGKVAPIILGLRYVGTVCVERVGNLVFHLFEAGVPS